MFSNLVKSEAKEANSSFKPAWSLTSINLWCLTDIKDDFCFNPILYDFSTTLNKIKTKYTGNWKLDKL